MSIRQFAFHDRVASTPPECRMKELYDKCKNDISNVSNEEKQKIFDMCRSYNGIYKLAGWQFDFRSFMKRYVVKQYDSWHEQYAFSKTNIRSNVYTKTDIQEIHEIPHK
jgi:hypothetical protein